MKSILYVGATLMIGASIYGFADYKQNAGGKKLEELYTEKKTIAPSPGVTEEKPAPVEKKEILAANPAVVKKQATKKAIAVAPVKPIADNDKMVPEENKLIEKTAVTVTPSKENIITKKVNKKKKISTKLFSRAPIREDREEEILLKEPKKEPVKTKDKEQ